jgi:hypothetical protein
MPAVAKTSARAVDAREETAGRTLEPRPQACSRISSLDSGRISAFAEYYHYSHAYSTDTLGGVPKLSPSPRQLIYQKLFKREAHRVLSKDRYLLAWLIGVSTGTPPAAVR